MKLADLAVVHCIASGPTSSVFLAHDCSKDKRFALKRIPLRDGGEIAKQELTIASKLCKDSSHLVEYEAAFVDGDSLYLLMEECAGGDLYAYLQTRPDQRLSERDALDLWRQVVLGVQSLHNAGIAHRDLSLENVLLDQHQRVAKVCDFGLSTIVTKGEYSHGRVGKCYYMAPEVAADEPYDAMRADVWSLGILLFILLTGSPLVQTATQRDPAFQALQRVGVHGILRHWCMDTLVSSTTVRLLQQLLQPSPSQRIPSTQAILDHLTVG